MKAEHTRREACVVGLTCQRSAQEVAGGQGFQICPQLEWASKYPVSKNRVEE